MGLAKQLIQFFFGATNQDTSRRNIMPGNLVRAVNVQRLHADEHIKRGGFTQAAQHYEGTTGIVPDSIVSPDGVQVISRHATTDAVFARSTDATHHMSKGASRRFCAKWPTRFQALDTGEQAAPMPKQAGNYYVWLKDESTFCVALRSNDQETLLNRAEYAVAGPSSGDTHSNHVKSFAVIDAAAFDPDYLWIFWVDWTTKDEQHDRDGVWFLKVKHDFSASAQGHASAGTQSNAMLTGISVAMVAANTVVIAVVGVHPDNSGSDDYTNKIAFRQLQTASANWKTFTRHWVFRADESTIHSGGIDIATNVASWTASGICILTAYQQTPARSGRIMYSFWGCHTSDVTKARLYIVDANIVDDTGSFYDIATVDNVGHTKTGSTPLFIGSTTGHETASGAFIAAQFRIYYGNPSTTFTDPPDDLGCYPDRLFTTGYAFAFDGHGGITVDTAWTARGAWLACGWFAMDDGTECLITGWEDSDGIQMPYHLRRLDTGAILCQFAYGDGAFAGHAGKTGHQIVAHIADIQQPILSSSPVSVAAYKQLTVATTSAALSGSCDVANVTIDEPAFANPVTFRSFALYPGPIPTVASGWQPLREAGPLVGPSALKSAWGAGAT